MFENSLNNQTSARSIDRVAQFDQTNKESQDCVWMDDLFGKVPVSENLPGFNSMQLVCETGNVNEKKQDRSDEKDPYEFEKARIKSDKTHSDTSKRVDHYESLEELKKDLKDGKDFRIETKDRKSKVTVVAPHGGYIEPGSSELARAIAGEDFNLYDFKGLDNNHPRKAHVTSAKFKDPQLSKLLDSSDLCVSVHGMRGEEKAVFVGGRNKYLRAMVAKNLKDAGFPATADPPRFKGEHPNNLVNKPKDNGVQLELSWGMRKEIMSDNDADSVKTSSFDSFVNAVRKAITDYQNKR